MFKFLVMAIKHLKSQKNQPLSSDLTSYGDLLITYCDTNGPSGHEMPIAAAFLEHIKPIKCQILHDNLGSVIAVKKGQNEKVKILLAAHMDEIGFIVQDFTSDGYVKITSVGGWWNHVVLGQRFKIITADKKEICGVVGSIPIHVLPQSKQTVVISSDQMYLDIGTKTKTEIENFGIQIGDPIVRDAPGRYLTNPQYVNAKAIDNRAGVTVLTKTLLALQNVAHPNTVYGACTVQEEVGLRGAKTTAAVVNPTIAIILDTTVSYDWEAAKPNSCCIGAGVALSIMDRSCICNLQLVRFLAKLAKKHDIKFTYNASVAGGTDAGTVHLHNTGVITAILSIPTRYLHTHNEVCDLNDVLAATRLITEFIQICDASLVQTFQQH